MPADCEFPDFGTWIKLGSTYLNGDFTGLLPFFNIRSDIFVHVLADKTLKPVMTGFIEWVVVLAVPCGIRTWDFGGES